MKHRFASICAFSALSSLLVLTPACSSTSSGGAATDAGAGADGGSSVLGFSPSNVDLTGIDLSAADDVVLHGTNCVIDGDVAEGPTFFQCAQDVNNRVVHKNLMLGDGSHLSVFIMKSLRIDAGTTALLNRGTSPVVLVALGTMVLDGSIDVTPGIAGGSVNTAARTKGSGTGGGTAGDATGLAGGGASYCGLGGKGGTQTATMGSAPVPATSAWGGATLIPLVGGSAGGSGAVINNGPGGGGSGGGALQLVAGTSFELHAMGFISAGGGGGAYGGLGKDGAGGGGSGGSILIESRTVTIAGAIAANGGGGGQGNGDVGENGAVDHAAKGGAKAMESGAGGLGSFGTTLDGADGPSSSDATLSASSGGGGAGRIRINTQTGTASITGALSPAATTACATQGTLAK